MEENYIFNLLTSWEEDLFDSEILNQEENFSYPSNKVITTILSFVSCETIDNLTLNHNFVLCLN